MSLYAGKHEKQAPRRNTLVVIAILPQRGASKRFVFKTKRFSALAKASHFLLKVVKRGWRERRRH
jgi:hypothetical protein